MLSLQDYVIYWIGGGIALLIGAIVGVVQLIRNRSDQ